MELKDVKDALQAESQREFDPDDPYAWLKADLKKFLAPAGDDETHPAADNEDSNHDLAVKM